MIRRFPREKALHVKGESSAFSMNDVHDGLWRLASGKYIGPRRIVLIRCWFGLPNVDITESMARQIIAQLKSGAKKVHIRFPRRERNGS